jgi:DNA repair protein RadC
MSAVLPFPITASAPRQDVPSADVVPIRGAGLSGHRERLRDRARGAGLHHLPDYELLELFLFRSQPQGDVKPIAKALLARFGSLAAVLAASVEDLMTVRAEDSRGRSKGVGAETALDLAALHEVARRVAKEEANKRTVISSWTALLAYVRLSLQHEPREQFRGIMELSHMTFARLRAWLIGYIPPRTGRSGTNELCMGSAA